MASRAELFPDLSEDQFVQSDEIARVATKVLNEHAELGDISRLADVRTALREGDITVTYLLNVKPFDPVSDEAKHDAIAKCVKAPGLWHDITGFDIAIWVRSYFWGRFDETSREALLAHELLHLDVEYDDNGECKLGIRKHDLEEFNDVVATFGAVLPAIPEFLRAADPAKGLRDLVADPESGVTSITVKAGGRTATIGRQRDDATIDEAARGFSADQGQAALDELNGDLDGQP